MTKQTKISREDAAREIAKELGYRLIGNSDEVGRTGWLCGTGKWIEQDCTAAEFAFWDALVSERIARMEAEAVGRRWEETAAHLLEQMETSDEKLSAADEHRAIQAHNREHAEAELRVVAEDFRTKWVQSRAEIYSSSERYAKLSKERDELREELARVKGSDHRGPSRIAMTEDWP